VVLIVCTFLYRRGYSGHIQYFRQLDSLLWSYQVTEVADSLHRVRFFAGLGNTRAVKMRHAVLPLLHIGPSSVVVLQIRRPPRSSGNRKVSTNRSVKHIISDSTRVGQQCAVGFKRQTSRHHVQYCTRTSPFYTDAIFAELIVGDRRGRVCRLIST